MKLKRFGHLLLLWVLAIAVSTVKFSQIYDELPSASETLLGHLVYGVLALPFSLLHTVTFQGSEALRIFGFGFFLIIVSYWGVLFGAQLIYIRRGGKLLLAFSTIIILMSSFKWLYYAMAMSGI